MVEINGTHQVREALVGIVNDYFIQELGFIEEEEGLQPGVLTAPPRRASDTGLVPRFLSAVDVEAIPLGNYPAILFLADSTPNMTHIDTIAVPHPTDPNLDRDGEIFKRTNSIRVLHWVTGNKFEETCLKRDRSEKAFWRTIWRHRQLAENAGIMTNTYTSSFADVEPTVEYGEMLAGFQARFQVVTFENLATIIQGKADTIETTLGRLVWADESGGI